MPRELVYLWTLKPGSEVVIHKYESGNAPQGASALFSFSGSVASLTG